MPNKWNRMDHEAWNDSEVMQDFEQLLLKYLKKASDEIDQSIKKEAQDGGMSQKIDSVSKSTETAAKNMGNLINLSKNLVDDPEEDSRSDDEIAKEALLSELHELAATASLRGDHKEAFSIERVIDEIELGA